MRLLLLEPAHKRVQDLGAWPAPDGAPPPAPEAGGFYWLSCTRAELEAHLPAVQQILQHCGGSALLDLHVSDLLNPQIPSTFDYTSDYDVMLFRRLELNIPPPAPEAPATRSRRQQAHAAHRAFQHLETAPIGFAVFDTLLLSVHPETCYVRAQHLQRLLHPSSTPEKRANSTRLPAHSAELMLRQLDQMVDGYLNLRRDMAKQIDAWQMALLDPHSRFSDWGRVLQARLALHQLDEIAEDQRAAVQDWLDTLDGWSDETSVPAPKTLELLRVRSRDVLEHIERVIHHVRRMEQSAETAVQMHFSAQSNRANDIMRTLTTLTAVFLPLNLIAAIFGMNFEFIPLIHQNHGFWWAMGSMALIAAALLVFFWRRRFLDRNSLK